MHIFIVVTILLVVVAYVYHHMRSSRRPAASAADTVALSIYERTVTEGEFPALVLRNSYATPVLVMFYANGCEPCRYFGPILAAAAKDYDGAFLLAKVDYDSNKQLVAKYGISSVPTVVLIVQGECGDRFVGAKQPHQLRFFLSQHGIEAPTDFASQSGNDV